MYRVITWFVHLYDALLFGIEGSKAFTISNCGKIETQFKSKYNNKQIKECFLVLSFYKFLCFFNRSKIYQFLNYHWRSTCWIKLNIFGSNFLTLRAKLKLFPLGVNSTILMLTLFQQQPKSSINSYSLLTWSKSRWNYKNCAQYVWLYWLILLWK